MNPLKSTETTTLGQLSLPSKLESLLEVDQLLEEINRKIKFKDDVYGNIMVAVMEAVNNAITHGNQNQEQKLVDISFVLDGYRLLVTVKDEGNGFDSKSLADPTAPENIEKIGGRGVFLMEQLSDDMIYNDQGREVIMAFNI
jgi:serine/threonine-protein kinase RsbW